MNNSGIAHEWQFDGLVGPTHNYAGLAFGNVAAMGNAGAVSNPRQAAEEGLKKAKVVRDLGIRQAFLPPHFRPLIPDLKRLGFEGPNNKILGDAYRATPHLLASIYSSAFMWVANAATVTPSADSGDNKLHFTPANLLGNYHRSLETNFTTKLLSRIFKNSHYFTVNKSLPASAQFSDEGAANHMRVCDAHKNKGQNIFVFGSDPASANSQNQVKRFPARQTKAAFEMIARQHGLAAEDSLFIQQNPEAIDAGVFHNDVIAMNTTRLMLAHERAFIDSDDINRHMTKQDSRFIYKTIRDDQLTLQEAVSTYFFNSQLLEMADASFNVIAPAECRDHPRAKALFDLLIKDGLIAKVHYLDVRESMRNGGGPACLRLRVVMTEEESAAMHQGIVLTDATYDALLAWVRKHYRDRLTLDDLRDPHFIDELNDAYAALEPIIGMPGLYDL